MSSFLSIPVCEHSQSARFFIYLSPFIFNALAIAYVVAMVTVVIKYMYLQTYMVVCTIILYYKIVKTLIYHLGLFSVAYTYFVVMAMVGAG